MERTWSIVAVTVVLMALGAPAVAAPEQEWSPPVDGPVVRGYESPQRPFGPQHLGLDYAAVPGTPVRAAADGVVAFAGQVGKARSVAVEHPGTRRTSYAYLRRTLVLPGAAVRRGDPLGISGGPGPGHPPDVVHFGYRVAGEPRDPAPLFRARPRISLAPLDAPACPARLGEPADRPATLNPNPASPGREYTRPYSIGVRP